MESLFKAQTKNGDFVIDKILETGENAASIIEQLFNSKDFPERLRVLGIQKIGNQFVIDKILEKKDKTKIINTLFSSLSDAEFHSWLYSESTLKNFFETLD